MKIKYKTHKLENIITQEKELKKEYGKTVCNKVLMMIQFIESAISFRDILKYPPARCHPLKGKRQGEFAIDLGKTTGYRLIIVPLDEKENRIIEKDLILINKNCEIIGIEEVSKHYE